MPVTLRITIASPFRLTALARAMSMLGLPAPDNAWDEDSAANKGVPVVLRSLILMIGMLLLVTGCGSTNRQPRYDVKGALEVKTFKRYAKHNAVDYLHTWKSKAYSKVESPLTQLLSPTQQSTLERHGQPDFIRKSFRAATGELVDEWAWWDRGTVAQFVGRELVYEGPLTEMDRYRIRYGYPRRSRSQTYESGVRRDIWDYQGIFFDPSGVLVTFTDENLVSRQEY